MGIFGSVGSRVAKEHGHVFGWTWVSGGYAVIRGQWGGLRSRRCPACNEGRLIKDKIEEGGKTIEFYGCTNCEHYQAAKPEEDADTMDRLRTLAAMKLDDEEVRLDRIKFYRRSSRMLYGFALFSFFLAVWLLIQSPHSPQFAGVAMLGLFTTVKALVSSYRCWQLQEKRLFEPGLFKSWVKKGEWFV